MMNCRFADLTQFESFQFIKNFPESNEGLTTDYKIDLEDYNIVLNDITKNVIRFVNILIVLVRITTSYVDTTLVKTLVFLQYKIHFITSMSDISVEKSFKSDDDIKYIF